MNNFEIKFFKKYIPEGEKVKGVIHKHLTEVFWILIFWMSLAFIPAFLYYYSLSIKEIIPFYFLEGFLILIYIKLIYDVFDWYNDVWIVTDEGIVDLQWSLFKKNVNSVSFGNIEGLEVNQNGFVDSIFKRGDLVIHKIGDDNFLLENVYKPFKHVNLIEEISTEINHEDEASVTEKRFDMIINTLGNIMEGHMGKNYSKQEEDEEETLEKIEIIKNKEGTIDLR